MSHQKIQQNGFKGLKLRSYNQMIATFYAIFHAQSYAMYNMYEDNGMHRQ